MNKPDEIVIKQGIIYVLREVETLPDFSKNYQIITALKIEDAKKAIEQINQSTMGQLNQGKPVNGCRNNQS